MCGANLTSYRWLISYKVAGEFFACLVARLEYFTARQPTGDQPVGREIRNDLATVLGDHNLFLNTRCPGAVLSALPGLERENHPLFEGCVLAAITLGNYWSLPQRQANAVTILERPICGYRQSAGMKLEKIDITSSRLE